MKKKLEVSNRCYDFETFNKYFSPECNKIIGEINIIKKMF